MKKFLAYGLMLCVLAFGACKKGDDKKAAETKPANQAKPGETFKPQPKKKRAKQQQVKGQVPASLEIYNEKNLVTSIPSTQYATIATTPLKVNDRQVKGILLKDLLSKYKVQGKNVILVGNDFSTPLKWEQVAGNDVYVYITPTNAAKIYTNSKALTNVKFPKRLLKITVSETTAQVTSKTTT